MAYRFNPLTGAFDLFNSPIGLNLLDNSGFGVWSNSTLENVGSDLIANGDVESALPSMSGSPLGSVRATASRDSGQAHAGTYSVKVASDGTLSANYYARFDGNNGTEGGKLYRYSVWVYLPSAQGTNTLYLKKMDADDSAEIVIDSTTTTDAWVQLSGVIEKQPGTAPWILGIQTNVVADPTGEFFYFDDLSVYEVTPGCVAADNKGPDGWYKDGTLDVYREHDGSNTKGGSFYSVKHVPTTIFDYIRWPAGDMFNNSEFAARFDGKTVTLGCWAKTSSANHAFLKIWDGVGTFSEYSGNVSSYHTGGGGWEWLEVTATISASNTEFAAGLLGALSTETIYWSQPMLVLGSSIGEGNYAPKPNEIIVLEQYIALETFEGNSFSTGAAILNLEADTRGKLPKNVDFIDAHVEVRDSASSTVSCHIGFRDPTGENIVAQVKPYGIAGDDFWYAAQRRIPCNTDGDIKYGITASGSGTFDAFVRVLAVKLR